MSDIHFRVWHYPEKKMYYRGYQKVTHVLLCEDDEGSNEGRGTPVKGVPYEECEMMQGTGIRDTSGREIFEGDLVEVRIKDKIVQGLLESIPDMYKSRNLHPLHCILAKHNIDDQEELDEIKILGNQYENKN